MLVKVLSTFQLGGGRIATKGETIEMTENEARAWITVGYVAAAEPLPPEKGEVRLNESAKPSKAKPGA